MNALMNNEVSMTSRDIAELAGRPHNDILKEIRKEISALGEIGVGIFSQSSYLNSQNKQQPQFTFGKKGAMQLALKYDAVTRFKVIEKIEELELKTRDGGFSIPKTFVEALELATKNQREIELLSIANKGLKVKEVVADAVSDTGKNILVKDLSVILSQNGYKTGQNRLWATLREDGFIGSLHRYSPTSRSMEMGLFFVERKPSRRLDRDGSPILNVVTKVTGKGVSYFIKYYLRKKVDIIANSYSLQVTEG